MGSIGLIFRRMTVLAVVVALTGCASAAQNINAAYVSPEKYQGYDCDQIGREINTVDSKVAELSSSQDSAAVKDAVALLVCPMVLWPVLYLVMDGDNSDDLAQLKGERAALANCAVEKQCTTLMANLDAEKVRQEAKAQAVARQQAEVVARAGGNET